METGVRQHAKIKEVSGIEPEFGFLCRAVGAALDCNMRHVVDATPEKVDQARLIHLAIHHRCLPLMAKGLEKGIWEGQPGWVTLVPEHQIRVNRRLALGAGRAVFLARHLVALLGDFATFGIRAMALKGPAMAQMLYGHIDYRPSDDLDIWVHPRDFEKACAIMEEKDFTPLVRLSPIEARAHMKAGWDRGFRSPAGDFVVELCTGMAPRYFVRPPDADAFWEGARDLTLEGSVVRTPGPGPLLELLCLHGLKHGWSRLLWVADVAVLGGSRGGVNWESLRQQARRHGTERMIDLGLRLACVHLGADVRGGEVPPGLAHRASRVLSGRDRCAGFRQEMPFHLAGRERWWDRIRYVLLVLFTPSFGDWRWISLPEKLFWMHRILHPVRLLVVAVKKESKNVNNSKQNRA